MVDIKKIATFLEATRISPLEVIANDVHANNQEEFTRKFALEVARRKLEVANYDFSISRGNFDFIINAGKGVLVGVESEKLVEDDRKASVEKYLKTLNREIGNHDGLVYFVPYQFNNRNLRKNISKRLPVSFVNLTYNERILREGFLSYVRHG